MEKVKKIFHEEESIRQNREESENIRKAFSEPVLSEPMFPEGEIKAKPYRSLPEKPDSISNRPKLPTNMLSNKIQVLHSVFDQPTEMNEWTNMNTNVWIEPELSDISSDETSTLIFIHWLLCFNKKGGRWGTTNKMSFLSIYMVKKIKWIFI